MRPLRKLTPLLVLVAVLLAAGPMAGNEATSGRFTVWVDHSGDDPVGQLLAYEVREEVRRSEAYDLGTFSDALFMVLIITLDPNASSELKGSSTAASVAYTMANMNTYEEGNPQTWFPIYLSSITLTAGRNRVDDQAKSIVAELDAQVSDLLEFYK